MFHQRVVRVEIAGGPAIGQLPCQQACRVGDRSRRRHDAEALGDAQVMGVDDQRTHLKSAEVQDRGAHLRANAGQRFEPNQGIVDRPIFQEIQVQAAAPRMDLPQRRRQVHGLPLCKGEWREIGKKVFLRCIADGFPRPELLNQGPENPFRDRGVRARAQEGQNKLAERGRAQPCGCRPIVFQQCTMDFYGACRR